MRLACNYTKMLIGAHTGVAGRSGDCQTNVFTEMDPTPSIASHAKICDLTTLKMCLFSGFLTVKCMRAQICADDSVSPNASSQFFWSKILTNLCVPLLYTVSWVATGMPKTGDGHRSPCMWMRSESKFCYHVRTKTVACSNILGPKMASEAIWDRQVSTCWEHAPQPPSFCLLSIHACISVLRN